MSRIEEEQLKQKNRVKTLKELYWKVLKEVREVKKMVSETNTTRGEAERSTLDLVQEEEAALARAALMAEATGCEGEPGTWWFSRGSSRNESP